MTSPSKNKGNSFERQTADFLTNLYGEKFIRAQGSGAYVGGKNNKRKEFLHEGQIRSFKGDIVPGSSFPRFNAECKSYKEFPFHQFFSGNIKILDVWIKQCLDASDDGDFNIIFMKFNRKGVYVAVQNRDILHYDCHFTYNHSEYGKWVVMSHDLFWKLNSNSVRVLCNNE
jgi:hypothetical protein